MIQKQSDNHRSGRTHNHEEKKEFNKEHAHCSSFEVKGIIRGEIIFPNTTVNS
jgi:hypothetical protein